MPSTSVHLPTSLLEDLDLLASERGISRNRLITEACREALRKRRQWPKDFFESARFSTKDLEELRGSAQSFEQELLTSRRSRKAPPF
jgi:Arc/MetJ-type ribon-helix-helix transcriptional regulator